MNFRRGQNGDAWTEIRDSALFGAIVGGLIGIVIAGVLGVVAGPPANKSPVITYTLSDGTRCAVPREGAGISCDWRKP